MKADGAPLSHAAAQLVVDVLFDPELLAETLEAALPRPSTRDVYFRQAAVELLHTLVRAAAPANDAAAVLERVRSWLGEDLTEPAELLDRNGDGFGASILEQRNDSATREAVAVTAVGAFDTLLRVAAEKSSDA